MAESEEMRRETSAMAAEDEASTRWRVAAAAEETAKQSRREITAMPKEDAEPASRPAHEPAAGEGGRQVSPEATAGDGSCGGAPRDDAPGDDGDGGDEADGDVDGEHSEDDEMCNGTERSSSSEPDDGSSSEGSSSESEGPGDGDESGLLKEDQLRGPVTEGVRKSADDAASLPKGVDAGEAGDAAVVADTPGISGPRTEDVPVGEDGNNDVQSGGEDDGVDDFSDVSDDSDLFHAEAKDVGHRALTRTKTWPS